MPSDEWYTQRITTILKDSPSGMWLHEIHDVLGLKGLSVTAYYVEKALDAGVIERVEDGLGYHVKAVETAMM